MTLVRLPDFHTREEAEAAAHARGLRLINLERGPDGMIRGLAAVAEATTEGEKEP